MLDPLAEARQTMVAAAAKAPGGRVESFGPYLRAAIAYWRLEEEAAQAVDDLAKQLHAVTQRIELEEHFRTASGRSYHTVEDAITSKDVDALPGP